MITNKQLEWIKAGNRKNSSTYMLNIQKHISKMLDNGIWLAKNHPEILLNEYGNPQHQRYQQFLQLLLLLKPKYLVYLEVADNAKKLFEESS